jgi:heptosyltransferase-2
VDEIITLDAGEGPLSVGWRLRKNEFDVALVLPNSPRSALEVWLARIPQRIGYARRWRNFLLTNRVPPRAEAVRMRKRSVADVKRLIANPARNSKFKTQNSANHQVHEYLHLAAALGANPEPLPPQLFVAAEEIEATKRKFGLAAGKRTYGAPVPLFGMCPGAEYGPAKRWPAERFIAAARLIHARTDCAWLIFGGRGDVEIARHIEIGIENSKLRIQNLAGTTSLRELMALLGLCRVLLTNDSGPMHLAAALGARVVVPFGSTSAELTGPGLPGDPRQRWLSAGVPCSPCFRRTCPVDFRCMTGISVERVVAAVLEAVAAEERGG